MLVRSKIIFSNDKKRQCYILKTGDYKVIYSAPNYTYIAVYPTDLQYDSDDEDLTALYQKMASELTDSFLWNIHIAEE